MGLDTTTLTRGLRAGPVDCVGHPRIEERRTLLDWLDDGLRDGRRGSLLEEFPLAIRQDALHRHSVILREGRIVSHAIGVRIDALSGDHALPCGLVSLVYTDPRSRGQGLASLCVDHCVEQLRARGAAVALLWSDQPRLYRRLGFEPTGREWLYRIDNEICQRAAQLLEAHPESSPLRDADLSELSRLYDARSCRAARSPSAIERLARTPQCRVRVVRGPNGVEAYAAVGRGEDFGGIVHEWAGRPDAVISCLSGLCANSSPEAGALGLVAGPLDEDPLPVLRAAGAAAEPRSFALGKILDRQRAWAAWAVAGAVVVPDPRERGPKPTASVAPASVSLSQESLLALLFGPEPERARACRSLTSGSAAALALPDPLPAPFFLWGFDSI